jgi:hypothetical protein
LDNLNADLIFPSACRASHFGKQQWLIKSWLFALSAKRSEHWKNAVGLAPRTASGVFSTSWWRFSNGPI